MKKNRSVGHPMHDIVQRDLPTSTNTIGTMLDAFKQLIMSFEYEGSKYDTPCILAKQLTMECAINDSNTCWPLQQDFYYV